jgi:hypothetical protein
MLALGALELEMRRAVVVVDAALKPVLLVVTKQEIKCVSSANVSV